MKIQLSRLSGDRFVTLCLHWQMDRFQSYAHIHYKLQLESYYHAI